MVAAFAATILFGCGSSDGYGVAKDPTVVPPKPFEQLTKEEKLERINKLPVPEAEKVKMRAELGADSK
ncbi:MAG: hypothetical protein WCK51_03130 [Armatimonadota bacterium]